MFYLNNYRNYDQDEILWGHVLNPFWDNFLFHQNPVMLDQPQVNETFTWNFKLLTTKDNTVAHLDFCFVILALKPTLPIP